MNTDYTLNKKNILSDPVAAFITANGDVTADKKSQLEQLWQQYGELGQSIKDKKIRSKKLSRQIGEAKRDNKDIGALLKSMQESSKDIKNQTLQITDIENEMLGFFDLHDEHEDHRPEKPGEIEHAATTRQTANKVIDTKNITIKRLVNQQIEWDDYVNNHPSGCIHHLSKWASLFKQSYGHESYYFYACDDDNNIVGVLPLIRLNSHLFGDLLVSMPFFQRAGAIAEHPSIEQRLIRQANLQAKKLGIEHIEYRDNVKRENMPTQTHKVNMVLALPDKTESLWQAFNPKLRAQIRRPQRENTRAIIGREDLLDDFYSVYARNMRDLGSPPHSKIFIASILEQFPDNSWLMVIRLNEKPVAAGLLLGHKQTLEIPLASTVRDVNSLSINMLLYWEVLQFAINKGFKEFDFGRSSIDAGTYKFKKQWGAKPKQLYWHYWLEDSADIPGINPSNPKYKLVISVWKRLPVFLTTLFGPWIAKNIP